MPRQDSLNNQMTAVMKAAVEMGCLDAHDWLVRNFRDPNGTVVMHVADCTPCSGIGCARDHFISTN